MELRLVYRTIVTSAKEDTFTGRLSVYLSLGLLAGLLMNFDEIFRMGAVCD